YGRVAVRLEEPLFAGREAAFRAEDDAQRRVAREQRGAARETAPASSRSDPTRDREVGVRVETRDLGRATSGQPVAARARRLEMQIPKSPALLAGFGRDPG